MAVLCLCYTKVSVAQLQIQVENPDLIHVVVEELFILLISLAREAVWTCASFVCVFKKEMLMRKRC